MEQRKITFDEIPYIMQGILDEMEKLNLKMQTLSQKQDEQNKITAQKISHRPMGTSEVSEYLHLSQVTIYRMVAHGDIPYCKQGKHLLFYEDEVSNWLKNGRKMDHSSVMDYAKSYCSSNPI